jgi:flagellar M-ring protein FliF
MPSSLKQIADVWSQFTKRQKAATVGVVALMIILLGTLAYQGAQPEFETLFSDLRPAVSQGIVEKLKEKNVPYRLSADGSSIAVPHERITELRLEIASSGQLSGGHVGFDIFDKTGFGVTDFTQQVNYQRAIEGELAKTLEGMEEVAAARVHVTRPKESLFTQRAEPAKASVLLTLRGRDLAQSRISSIVNLVSSAVEGLEPEAVSVMDSHGRLLTDPRDENGAAARLADSQLEVQSKYEADAARRITDFLEPVLGPGRVRVDVSAQMDFSQQEETEEKYAPEKGVVRTQQTLQEVRNGAAAAAGGVAGTRANDPAQPPPPPATTGGGGGGRTSTSTTYEIDKLTRKKTLNGARVSRLTVSVLVDENAGVKNGQAFQPSEVTKIQEAVGAAVGFNTQRGDQIVVRSIPFRTSPDEMPAKSWFEKYGELVRPAVKYGSLALLFLALMLFVGRPLLKAVRPPREETAGTSDPKLLGAGATDNALSAGQDALPARTVAELQAALDGDDEPSGTRVPVRFSVVKKTLLEQAKEKPEAVAASIRTWMNEDLNR